MAEYIRNQYNILRERIDEPRKFIQVLAGPRQVEMNSGLPKFTEAFHPTRSFVVGTGGIPLETFLSCNLEDLIN